MLGDTRSLRLGRGGSAIEAARADRRNLLIVWGLVVLFTAGATSAQGAFVEVTTVVNLPESWIPSYGVPWKQTTQSSLGPVTLDSGWITGGPSGSGIPDGVVRAAGYADYGRLGVEAEAVSGQWGGGRVLATFKDTWTLLPTDPARIGNPYWLRSYVTVSGSWEGWGWMKVKAPGGEQYAGSPYVESGSYAGTLVFEKYFPKLGDPYEVTFTLWGQASRQTFEPEMETRIDYLHTAVLSNLLLMQGGSIEYQLLTESGHNYGFGVPEPSSLLLLAAGWGALGLRRGRRRSRVRPQSVVNPPAAGLPAASPPAAGR